MFFWVFELQTPKPEHGCKIKADYFLVSKLIQYSLVDSRKNRSKSEESMKIGTFALFDALFRTKTGHKLCKASAECF